MLTPSCMPMNPVALPLPSLEPRWVALAPFEQYVTLNPNCSVSLCTTIAGAAVMAVDGGTGTGLAIIGGEGAPSQFAICLPSEPMFPLHAFISCLGFEERQSLCLSGQSGYARLNATTYALLFSQACLGPCMVVTPCLLQTLVALTLPVVPRSPDVSYPPCHAMICLFQSYDSSLRLTALRLIPQLDSGSRTTSRKTCLATCQTMLKSSSRCSNLFIPFQFRCSYLCMRSSSSASPSSRCTWFQPSTTD